MNSFLVGILLGTFFGMLLITVAYETSHESKIFDHTQDIINECQLELPRNEICVLKAVPEGEMK